MTTKQKSGDVDVTATISDWPMPDFSKWTFAGRKDQIDAKAVASVQKMNAAFWSHAEKAFDDHMKFVSHRLEEDFECAKSLSECSAPDDALATLQAFYTKMSNEYQSHFEKQAALVRNSFTENVAVAEELNETVMETVGDLEKTFEESLQGPRESEPKQREKAKPTKKTP